MFIMCPSDYLLCHDDQLEARRFAYIYYLSPDWEEKDGGDLQLFNCQEIKQQSTNGTVIKISLKI